MNRSTSLYLDLIRFLAAMVVFLGHAAQGRWSGGLMWQFTDLGLDAVMVFFVLSGFVIAYAAKERERSARTYTINRMARIYSVAIPALVLTFVIDTIGISWDPSLYLTWPDYVPGQMLWQFVNSVLFTNQVWFNRVQPGSIGPYWSMGYEVPYYIAFGIIAFAPRRWAGLGTALVMLAVGPNVAAFFPIWLLGFASYHLCKRQLLGKWSALFVWICSITAVVFLEKYKPSNLMSPQNIGFTAEGMVSTTYFYTLSFIFAGNIISFQWASTIFSDILEVLSKPIRWMGQRTFALYLLHMPIIQFIVAVTPGPPASWETRALVFLGVPIIVFGLAEFTERQKDFWRKGFDALFGAKSQLNVARDISN